MVDAWSTHEVCLWLEQNSLSEAKQIFFEQQIDGETLLGLTERMVEKLFPIMKHQVLFLKELEKLRSTSSAQKSNPTCDTLPVESNTHQQAHVSWPALYTLPVMPPELQEALHRKDPSFKKKDKSHLRALLIQVLFDHITTYTWYPNHKKYTDVLGCLITRFPFLRDHSSTGYDTLLECLRNKFKKERSPLVNFPKVMEMKRKFGTKKQRSVDHESLEDSPAYQRAKRRRTEAIQACWGSLDPTQEIVVELESVGEDDLSFQEHLNAINNELRRRQPDLTQIMDRMKRTLYKRVEVTAKPTGEVMQMFPFFQIPELLHYEMRLRFGQDMELNLQNALTTITANIIRAAQQGNHKEQLTTWLTEATTDDHLKSAAILILPELFKERSKFFYCLDEEPCSPFPVMVIDNAVNPLLCSNNVSIKMDGVTVTSGEMDIPHALQCLLEIYFIFGVEYPKQIRHTLSFVEHYFFKIQNTPVSIPVLKLYNQICS
ncbi:sterile alpha motif domain-containing protein 3-like [Neoarius graeffei]|uniref:sterile alpha motif domain-containing protein 3-like n=1 Tax=Neoarius graeffei TaxID=443677 RepID=UPI00298D4B08|nr:sterile alpha motif domain-containing protein 3-like [Neoarius graeffei]